MIRPLLILACAVLLSLFATPLRAATTCTAAGVAPINIVGYDGSAAASATTSLTITCNTTATSRAGTVYVNMCVYIGYPDGYLAPRRLKNGAASLNYDLYRSDGQPWLGAAYSSIGPQNVTINYNKAANATASGSRTFQITGTIPAQNGLVNGTYTQPYQAGDTLLQYSVSEPNAGGTQPAPLSCGRNPQTGTFPFTVSATVSPGCRVSTATDLDFGSIPGLMTANVDQLSQISLNCSSPTAWSVGLNNGLNAAGTTRRMRDASGNFVSYELYRDAARSQRWGSARNVDTVNGTGSGFDQTVSVFGRVPVQNAAPGDYSDIITVSVTY